MNEKTFSPSYSQGQTISASTSASGVTLLGKKQQTIVATNLGAVVAYLRVSSSSLEADATVADYPILPSTQISLTRFQDDDYISAITPSSTTSIHIIPGNGF